MPHMLASAVLPLCLVPVPTLLSRIPRGAEWTSRLYPFHMLIIGLFTWLSPLFTPMPSDAHYHIITFANQSLDISLHYDALSWVMLSLVSFIALMIQSYTARYLLPDANQNRFMAQLCLLTFSVMLLVISGSLFTAFLAWECIGLSLYLLLNHYHYDRNANKAAKKKFMINRVGDICFLLAVVLCAHQFGDTDYQVLFSHTSSTQPFVLVLIVIAIMTKSAQFPFHIWLIDTMEAPTPVSALMHGGVINAGGYLLARLSPWYDPFFYILMLISMVGLSTALMGKFFMQHQADTKKQLAYSTMGQMGYMLTQCGLGCFASAVFHLMAHGFYKASLFLSSGSTLSQGHDLFGKKESDTHNTKQATIIALLFTPIMTAFGITYFREHQVTLNPLLWFFMATTLFQMTRLSLQRAQQLMMRAMLITMIGGLFVTYLITLSHFNQLLSHSVAEEALPGLGWALLAALIVLITANALWQKILPTKLRQRWHYHALLLGIEKANIEPLYRRWLINPIRQWGDRLISLFQQSNTLSQFIMVCLAVGLPLAALFVHLLSNHHAHTAILAGILTIMLTQLIIANRIATLRTLMALLSLVVLTITALAFALGTASMQTIGAFQLINGFLVSTGLLILLIKRRQSDRLLVISENRLPWCHFYMSCFMMLLIGIPGTASFVSELYLLYGMAPTHFGLAAFFGANMLLLALVILHTLQIHFFNPDKIKQHATPIPAWLHLLCLTLIATNLLNGCHPSLLLHALSNTLGG